MPWHLLFQFVFSFGWALPTFSPASPTSQWYCLHPIVVLVWWFASADTHTHIHTHTQRCLYDIWENRWWSCTGSMHSKRTDNWVNVGGRWWPGVMYNLCHVCSVCMCMRCRECSAVSVCHLSTSNLSFVFVVVCLVTFEVVCVCFLATFGSFCNTPVYCTANSRYIICCSWYQEMPPVW